MYWSLIVLTILVLAGLASYGVWRYENSRAIAADRARFEQADKDVQAVAAAIQKAYPPQKQTYSKSCQYGSHEFEQPPITCSVMFRAGYIVNDSNQANQLRMSMERLLSDEGSASNFNKDSMTNNPPAQFKPLSATNGADEGMSEAYKDKGSNLDCTISYDYFKTSNAPIFMRSLIVPQSSQTVALTIECYGDVISKIF